jgi:hypothetical protein
MLWSSWLRYCVVSRKVAGSFGRTMTPGVNLSSKRNEYQGYLLGGGVVKADGA